MCSRQSKQAKNASSCEISLGAARFLDRGADVFLLQLSNSFPNVFNVRRPITFHTKRLQYKSKLQAVGRVSLL